MTASRSRLCALLLIGLGLAGCKTHKEPQTAAEAEPTRPAPPSGTMSLQGYYSSDGSTGRFQVCGTGQQWSVSDEGDVEALEQAYNQTSLPPGSVLLVEVEGGIDWRPGPGGKGKQVMLIVARFIGSAPGEACP
ncbi:MAG: hypothetical protein PVH21_00055 [Myxococcales bacterium]